MKGDSHTPAPRPPRARASLWGLGLVLITGLLLALHGPLGAQERRTSIDRFWILWERTDVSGENCPNGPRCIRTSNYTSRLFSPENRQQIYRLFGMLDGNALGKGQLAEHPDAPRICQHNAAEVALGFNPERLARGEKLDVLHGLRAFGMDLRNLKPPPGSSDTFGPTLQAEMTALFQQAGIRIVHPREARDLPGEPVLKVFFSHTGGNDRCDYSFSVFASLTQTVLLSRDIRVKVDAGVWSYSTNSTSFAAGDEAAAIRSVAAALITDINRVN